LLHAKNYGELHLLVPVALPEIALQGEHACWISKIEKYCLVMMGLHEKQNRSGPQIVEFQIVIDDFLLIGLI